MRLKQDIGEEDGERASAATALAAIGTENPLSADHGVNALGGTVAPENAVPIQSFSSAAVRTATLLERKSSFWRDCGQATNWGIGVGMADVVTATQPDVETFQ